MAHWNYKTGQVTVFKAIKVLGEWHQIDCGCSGGLEWGGDSPRECNRCGGAGYIFWHRKSKVFALYPGGPFCSGRGDLTDLELNGYKYPERSTK